MLGYNEFATETVVDAGEIRSAVVMVVGVGVGVPSTVQLDGESVVCRDTAAIVSPKRQVKLRRPKGGGAFLLRTSLDSVERRFLELTDRRPGRPLVFDRSVDLRRGVGAQVQRIIQSLAADLQRDPDLVSSPVLRAGYDSMFLSALLALPNTWSNELTADAVTSVAPALVRRAEEFLEAHAAEPVTVSDLVTHCGCSERSLFKSFRESRGYTPMQFLTDCRLKAARTALQSATAADTVTSIAYACGFLHPGRFAAAYRRRFGESPSHTLRRR